MDELRSNLYKAFLSFPSPTLQYIFTHKNYMSEIQSIRRNLVLNWRSKKFLQALLVLGLEKVFEMLANDDAMGQKLQDTGKFNRKMAHKKMF